MSVDYSEQPEFAVLADAVRRAEQHTPARDSVDGTLVVTQEREDTDTRVLDLERFEAAPRRALGIRLTYTPTSFIDYVKRVATPATSIWVDQTTALVTAVINDHVPQDRQGWGDHRVVLKLQRDPEWIAWRDFWNGGETHPTEGKRLHRPVETAEFLEQFGRSVVEPTPNQLLTIAATIHGTKTCQVEDMKDLHTGAVTLVVKETVQARAGTRPVKIPEQIKLKLAPYVGFDPVELEVKFRFRQLDEAGGLRLRFDPVRPDDATTTAIEQVRARIATELEDLGVYLGSPPEPRQPDTGPLTVGQR